MPPSSLVTPHPYCVADLPFARVGLSSSSKGRPGGAGPIRIIPSPMPGEHLQFGLVCKAELDLIMREGKTSLSFSCPLSASSQKPLERETTNNPVFIDKDIEP